MTTTPIRGTIAATFTVLLGYIGRRTTDGRMFNPGALPDRTPHVMVWVREPGPDGVLIIVGLCDVHVEGDEIRADGYFDRGVLGRCDPFPQAPHGWWATFSVDRMVFDEPEGEWDVRTFMGTGELPPVTSARVRSVVLQPDAHGICWEGDDVGLLFRPEAPA